MLKRISALLLVIVLIFGLAGLTMAASKPEADAQTTSQTAQAVPAAPEEGAQAPSDEEAPSSDEEPPVSSDGQTPASSDGEPEAPASPAEGESGTEEAGNFYLNEKPVQGMFLQEIDGVLYCGLRTFFDNALLECEVSWSDGQAQVRGATAEGEHLTLDARPGDCYVVANGRYLYVAENVRLVEGITMLPVDVAASVFMDSTVEYDEESGTARVTLGEQLLTGGEEFYDEESVELIARVITREAGFEPLEGKLALGNLIMNRVWSKSFPNTVYDVLYQKNQFTVVKSSKFWQCTPSEENVLAARLAMEGASILPTALFYNRAGMNSWAARNRTFVATIGHHSFYA